VRDWLHRDVESLDDAARLVLDDHLASCARCLGDREQLLRVRQLGESIAVPPPGAREYNRAIARALIEGRPRVATPVPHTRVWIPLAAFAAVAAAAVIGFVALRGRNERPAEPRAASTGSSTPQPPEAPPEVVASDVVDDGVVHAGTTAIAAGHAVPADTSLRADEPAKLRLAAAQVVIAAGAEVRWLPVERALLLERGAVDVHAATPGVARVVAEHFAADLDGADLTVERTSVRVHSGRATILAPSGAVLARLEAGGEWTLPTVTAVRTPRTHDVANGPTFDELMALARKQFAAREYTTATRTTEDALALRPRRDDEAEARTFLGDIAQASGDLALAARRYTAVADDFAGAPSAESALYAAARVELRRGRTAAARALLERYLDHHPDGRYADDVRRELSALPTSRSTP
jgi:hypothetical protein